MSITKSDSFNVSGYQLTSESFSNDTPSFSCMCVGSSIRVAGKRCKWCWFVWVSSQLNITGDGITIRLMETTLKNLENPLKKPLKNPGKLLWIFSGHPVFSSPYPYKLHTYSSNSSNRESDISHSAPSWEKQSSNLQNFCNIFQHFNFPFRKNEETNSLPVNACSPNKALLKHFQSQ